MRRKLSLYGFVLLLVCATIIIRWEVLYQTLHLLSSFLFLLFSDFRFASSQFSFALLDYFVSLILLFAIPGYIFSNKKKLLKEGRVAFSSYMLAVLLSLFLFAPVISNNNPDFQKDISVTRLLPPFSSVKILFLKNEVEAKSGNKSFLQLKKEVVKESFNPAVMYIDKVEVAKDVIIYYQGGIKSEIAKSEVVLREGIPQTGTRLFLLGTDELGRDIFTRVVYGTRISLLVGMCAVVLSLLLGGLLGFAAGYAGGTLDLLLSRLNEMFLSFPSIFFIILILAFFGNSFFAVVGVLGFTGWMSLFRIVKGEVVSLKNRDYFITARQLGLSHSELLFKEALPVIAAPIIVNTVFQFGNVVLSESALSFLGLGIGNDFPSWGGMMNAGQMYLSQAWWMICVPGAAIIITLITVNDFGRKITGYFNPRLSK